MKEDLIKMPKIILVTLLGLPATGKSTFVVHFQEYINHNKDFYVLPICYDHILHSNINEWKTIRKNILKNVENLFCYIKNEKEMTFEWNESFKEHLDILRLKENIIIIIDDNMYYRSMRYEYYQIARKLKINYSQIYFPCYDIQKVFERNRKRKRDAFVPEEVISRMAERFEEPNSKWEEGITFNINQDYDLEKICSWIEGSRPPDPLPENSLEENFYESNKNLIHRVDLILRKILHEKFQYARNQNGQENPQDLFKRMNTKRLEIIEKIKTKHINIPSEANEENIKTFLFSIFSL